jgi:ribonuclease R
MTRDELLRAFAERVTHPVSAREVIQLLKVPREARVGVRRQLRALAADGSLVIVRGHRFGLPGRMDLVVGRLAMAQDGYGFVRPETAADARGGDILVPAAYLKDAMHGDRVVARVEHRRTDARREGRVLRILERANDTVVGRFDEDGTGLSWVVPHERRLPFDIRVPPGETRGAAAGDMVVVAITRWPTGTRDPIGHVIEVIGRLDDPGVDTRVILRKHGIPDVHPADALAEARWAGREVRPADLEGRTDFRGLPVVTIDGEHARDFDDGVSVDRLANGHLRLGVHIADVAHYVREGSALDREAAARGTSVYFPDRAVHMLPEDLAAGLCSLVPGEDRLVQSCLMDLDRNGGVVACEFHDGVIRSAARLTYTEVNAALTGDDPAVRTRLADVMPLLERMRAVFDLLSERRRRRGAIDFDLPAPAIVLDTDGLIEAIVPEERNVAHRIIEECMLLANETVAAHLHRLGCPAPFRVHDAPDPFKVEEFAALATSLGFAFAPRPGAVRPADFQRLVDRVRGLPEEKPVAFQMLRTMQLARYEAVNRGHFGLALETYTHFTSPIRRYPDLVVHRVLRRVRAGELPDAAREALEATMPDIARQASDRERRATEAERELVQWKKARFMADKVGEAFDGVVTGVTAFGLFVELAEHFVEGLVHVATLADDYYRFDDRVHELRGETTRRAFRLGDRVRVLVARVDLDRRQIELGLVDVIERVFRRPLDEPAGRRRGKTGRPRAGDGRQSKGRRGTARQPASRRRRR